MQHSRLLSSALAGFVLAPLLALSVSAQSTTQVAVGFTDVPATAWYAQYVNEAASLGIVSGYMDTYGNLTGKFGPNNAVTIAEALKIALTSAGYDISLGQGYGHWAAKYMSIALGAHFQFTQNPNINLDAPASRAMVASMIADAFKVYQPVPATTSFSDVAPQMEFSNAIQSLAHDQVISGDTNASGVPTGTFRPLDGINRAEVVKIAILARQEYGLRGATSSSFYSSMSSSSSSFSVGQTCPAQYCGYAPGSPNWYCPDGSIGGPICEYLPDSRCGWVIRQCSSSSSSSSYRQSVLYNVLYTNAGFQPSPINIHVGDRIQFSNQSGLGMWVASNPYPTNNDYPGFDAYGATGSGGTFTFTFNKNGVYGYHNQLKPDHQAIVIIEQ